MKPVRTRMFVRIAGIIKFQVDKQAEDHGEIYRMVVNRVDTVLVATEAYIGRKQHEIPLE